ncbi:MAG: NEW3 domain-containing protein [Haloferacaceae archaeon]
MRRRSNAPGAVPLVVVSVVVLAAAAPVAVGTHADEVVVEGTVTGVDGAPADGGFVLVGEDATLTGFSPDELRALARDDPRNLTVVAVGNDGRFEATVDARRAEAAVAVSDAGISELVYVRGENATLDLRLYAYRPQIVHAHLGAVAADERRAELYVNLANSGDRTVENLSVGIGSLPDGWSVAAVETGGTYRTADRTLAWRTVRPGGTVEATVVLAVPNGTAVGTYRVGLRATSDTHRVRVEPETVEVLPADTPRPTTMPPATERPTGAPPSTPGEGGHGTTDGSGAGLGAAAAIAALAALLALALRGP